MYIPVEGERYIEWEYRKVKIKDFLKYMKVIEGMWGEGLNREVGYTIFPTLCYVEWYFPRSFGWEVGEFWERRGNLKERFDELMKDEVFKEYRRELRGRLDCERVRGWVEGIREEVERNGGIVLKDFEEEE